MDRDSWKIASPACQSANELLHVFPLSFFPISIYLIFYLSPSGVMQVVHVARYKLTHWQRSFHRYQHSMQWV